jgi:hypothetical protein
MPKTVQSVPPLPGGLQPKVWRLWIAFIIILLLLPACAPGLQTAELYVTAENIPTLTPFQPDTPEPAGLLTPVLSARESAANPTVEEQNSPIPPSTATPPPPTETPIPTATSTATNPPDTSHTSPALSASLIPDTPTYNLNVLWNYAGRSLVVSQEITYPNRSGETLDSILLAVKPNLWHGTFNLTALKVNDQPVSAYTLSGQSLTVPLPDPLQPGENLRLGLTYKLNLPYSSGGHNNFGYTARQTNLIDWYPFIPPYIPGQGWLLREPWAYGEHFAYPLADIYLGVTFSDPNPPILAASAPVTREGDTLRYVFRGRTFALSASHDFQTASADADGITVTSYYFPEHISGGARILSETQSALRTFQRAFGPYPHTSLAVVETELNDGLESDGLYFLASNFYARYDGSAASDLVMIGVHETAHQWWFGGVSNDQALEPWLDEALCTYAERIFYEENYPQLLNWWYNARIRYFNPSGYVDTRLENTTAFRPYVNAVYLRGALFLDALRNRMGDEAFFNFLRDYYARHYGQVATADSFFATLAGHTTNADDLIRTYFYYRR